MYIPGWKCVMSDEVELYFEDGRGNRITRKVKQAIDVRDFIGTPGYSPLVAAANTELSAPDIQRLSMCKPGRLRV